MCRLDIHRLSQGNMRIERFLLEIQRRILGSQTTTIWGYKKLTIKHNVVDEVFDWRGYVCVCPSYSWYTAIELGGAYVWKSFVLCIYNRGATVTSNKGKSYCPGHLLSPRTMIFCK